MVRNKNIEALLKEFLKVVSVSIKIKSLYLFGSYAKGENTKYSDIDVAIVSDDFEGIRFYDRQKVDQLIMKPGIYKKFLDFEIHPFKTEDFSVDNPFAEEIMKTGIKIA
ncbi:MAG: nucleotidyltransferase domain-containing protein [Ignavibacteriaceae bacterium]